MSHCAGVLGTVSTSSADRESIATYRRNRASTDSVGERETNLKLSKDRAAAVLQWLQAKGLAAKRLESEGFGPDKPLASNDTAEGRAKNRRVEFIVLEVKTDDAPSESTDW